MASVLAAMGGRMPRDPASRLLAKLLRQQARLRALHPQTRVPRSLASAAGGVAAASSGRIDMGAADGLAAGRRMDLDGELDAAFSNITNAAIVDVLVGVREDFGAAASAAATEGASFSTGGGGGGGGGGSKGSGATNDLYTSPAFAAGRVFSFATMDSIITEARFEPYIVPVIKQLVRAARKQRLVMLPVPEAIVMARLAAAAGGSRGALTPSAVAAARTAYVSELMGRMTAPTGGREGGASSAAAAAGAVGYAAEGVTFEFYGELFEALLRVWKLLPIGLYRRVHPATGLKSNPATAAAVAAAAGLPPVGVPEGETAFTHNRALVSYVYTNPEPSTRLSEHDFLYVLHADVDDEDLGLGHEDEEGEGATAAAAAMAGAL
jgi:hypothetical protein